MSFELVPTPVHIRHDPLGRSYTPEHIAQAIAERLIRLYGMPKMVLEPCVGGGAFVRPFHAHAHVVGMDIDPHAPGLALVHSPVVGDASTTTWTPSFADLSLTNPPFGKKVGQATTLAIAQRAIVAASTCALLVPIDSLTQVGWAPLIETCAEVWPIVGRVWGHERGMVVLVWNEFWSGCPRYAPLQVKAP